MIDFLIDNLLLIIGILGYVYFLKDACIRRNKTTKVNDAFYNQNHVGFRLLNWWMFRIFPMWPTHSLKVTSTAIYLYPSSWVFTSILVFKSDLFYEIKSEDFFSVSQKEKSLIINHRTRDGDRFDLEIYNLKELDRVKDAIETVLVN